MPYQSELDAARVRIRNAEEALTSYLYRADYDYQHHRQLVTDVVAARHYLLDLVASLSPETQEVAL